MVNRISGSIPCCWATRRPGADGARERLPSAPLGAGHAARGLPGRGRDAVRRRHPPGGDRRIGGGRAASRPFNLLPDPSGLVVLGRWRWPGCWRPCGCRRMARVAGGGWRDGGTGRDPGRRRARRPVGRARARRMPRRRGVGSGRTIERARHARWRRRWSQPSSLARQGIAARDVPGGGGALFGPLAGAPALARPHARHGVRDRGERLAVVAVRARWRHAERRAPVLRCSGAPCSRAAPSPPGPGPSGPGRSSRPLVPRWTRRPGGGARPARLARPVEPFEPHPVQAVPPARRRSRSLRQPVVPGQPNASRGSIPTASRRAARTRSRAGHPGRGPATGLPPASPPPRAAPARRPPPSRPRRAGLP